MNSRTRKAVPLIGVIIAGFAVAQTVTSRAGDKPAFALAVTAPSSIPRGSRLTVQIALTNTAPEAIRILHLGVPEREFGVSVLGASGQSAPFTERGRAYLGHERQVKGPDGQTRTERVPAMPASAREQRLKPGEVMRFEMAITELYDLSHPGTYDIQVWPEGLGVLPPGAQLWLRPGDSTLRTVRSKKVRVVVTP